MPTIKLKFSDRLYGDMLNATYQLNLPSNFKTNKLRMFLEDIYFDDTYQTYDMAKNIYNIHIPEIQQPDSYSTSRNNTTDIIFTGKCDGFTATDINKSDITGFTIDKNLLKCNTLSVKISAPRWNFTPYSSNLDYPPSNLSADTMTFSNLNYGNGIYTLTGASYKYRAFDGDSNTNTMFYNYNMNTGEYTGSTYTTASSSNYYGSYLDLKLPSPILLNTYVVGTGGDTAKSLREWVLLGSSNNGSTWNFLHGSGASNKVAYQVLSFSTSNNTFHCDKYRLVALRTGNDTFNNWRDIGQIAELRLNGMRSPPFTDYTMTLKVCE